jgi:AcrR family transcriptional regulator
VSQTRHAAAAAEEPVRTLGLRARKKDRTRAAIQDAALELFARQGYDSTTVEEIAAQAEVSTVTFFRYFRSKDEVIFAERHDRLSVLHRAILERPASESDLQVLQAALREVLAVSDRSLLARQTRAVSTSHVLLGRGLEHTMEWEAVICDGLARRNGLRAPDQACRVTARIAMVMFGDAVRSWALAGGRGDVGPALDDAFELLAALSAEWSSRKRAPVRGRRHGGRARTSG